MICISMFWQPSMGNSIKRDIKKSVPYKEESIIWLRGLSIKVPQELSDYLADTGSLKIGYNDYGGIYIKSIKKVSGLQKIIAIIPFYALSSIDYAEECRNIARTPDMLTKYILGGLEKKLD